jgi:uncharacterized Zn-binding protein involved in type VI secretion
MKDAIRLGDSTTHTVDGTPIARNGMKTACGVALIASGPKGVVIS